MGREWGVFWKGVCHGDVKSIPFLCPGLPSTSVPGQPSVTGARARCQHAGGSRPHSSRGLSRGGADVWRDFLYESYCAGNGEGRPAWVQVLDVETEPSLPWAGQFCSLGCSQRASVSPSHAFPPRGRGGAGVGQLGPPRPSPPPGGWSEAVTSAGRVGRYHGPVQTG